MKLEDVINGAGYRRANGDTYIKHNDAWAVKATRGKTDGEWIVNGSCEQVDPNEEVELA